MLSLSEQFAEFIGSATYDSLPADVGDIVARDVIDVVGCALWGYETPWGQRIVEHVARSEHGAAPVWGTDISLSAEKAALALGTLAHAIDFDDYHPGAKVHPATVVLPAAMSLGTTLDSSGRDVLLASALGFEVMIRVSLGTGSVAGMLNGYHMTGITGAIGAAAAAAKLLGLDQEKTAHALGLAATQSSGLMGFVHEGSDTKRLHAGKAAETGIVSAELARIGMTAPPHMLEMPHGGFMAAFSTDPRPARASEGLGIRWHTAEISFKRFACCGSIHSSLEAASAAMRDHAFAVEDLEHITVLQSHAVVKQCGFDYVPSNAMHAQMSMRYCLAVFLLDGDVLPAQFRDERLSSPEVLRLVEKISVEPDEEMDRLYPEEFASRVLIKSRGRVVEGICMSPSGSADNPMTTRQLTEKFAALAQRRLGHERVDAFLTATEQLKDAADLQGLNSSLVVGAVHQWDTVAT